jgi:hypothetical protein
MSPTFLNVDGHESVAVAMVIMMIFSLWCIAVQDGLDIIFGGSDGRWALANLTSLGAINKSNNEKYSAAIAELLEEHGVPSDRYYVNCFDVPRENCAYRVASFG